MKTRILLATMVALVAGAATTEARTRFLVSGGPTGTSEYGFQGGWSASLGVERQIARAGAFLVRLDGGALPSRPVLFYAMPMDIGQGGPGARDATVLALLAGLRLKTDGVVTPYLDVLMGVGYVNDPFGRANFYPYSNFVGVPATRNEANFASSIGPGVEVRTGRGFAVFADVHYDFYSVDAITSPLVPVRFGVVVR